MTLEVCTVAETGGAGEVGGAGSLGDIGVWREAGTVWGRCTIPATVAGIPGVCTADEGTAVGIVDAVDAASRDTRTADVAACTERVRVAAIGTGAFGAVSVGGTAVSTARIGTPAT
ncbi:hypothetical protein GORHZ_057_00490 [Gordonia rhizosphera NBRC 16068]|uniref:Uncharacterized protein n=1 Tax=Gordonia rhizosphera NBRC 16068 TaxID=1108045 RepID=K6WAZ0_9ACTN|nr:hypothetical protein GORHZ_057_00490 [Gordonia rhizosphera NBRC 16068]